MYAGANTEIPSRSLVDRARNIIVTPSTEWPVAAAEATSPRALFLGYVVPLALIPPIFTVLSRLLFFHHGLLIGIPIAFVMFVLELIAVFVVALIVDALAPSFGGQKNLTQALKLIAYSSTPRWVAGVLTIFPVIGPLLALVAGLYGLYLLYLGVPALTRVAPEKAAGFTIVTVVAAFIVWALVGVIAATVIAALVAGAAITTGAFSH